MEVNGIAHIFLTASNYQRSRDFYSRLLQFLGLKPVIDTETTYYCVGGRTAVGISAPSAEHDGAAFEQKRVGLHHFCFRARERADVDELARLSPDARRKDHPRAAPGSMGAGILFDFVRGPRRHPAGAQSCAGEGVVGLVHRCALPILRDHSA
jgi:catechol 2,3-dioxygenase-like lactoylglutathione lyase family enzyme